MKTDATKVLETAAVFYSAIPGYLNETVTKHQLNHMLIDLIDNLDSIEFSRSGSGFYDVISGAAPETRKKNILEIEQKYNLTEREGHILRFLANDRKPNYIADALQISPATVKTHKYAIFNKLGIHSLKELKELLAAGAHTNNK
jgi:DNA-binding NarL/FixJ family response regulator